MAKSARTGEEADGQGHDGPDLADEAPWSDHVSEFDEEHFTTYLRLLDADAEGARKEEMARIVLGIDAACGCSLTDPQSASAVSTPCRRALQTQVVAIVDVGLASDDGEPAMAQRQQVLGSHVAAKRIVVANGAPA